MSSAERGGLAARAHRALDAAGTVARAEDRRRDVLDAVLTFLLGLLLLAVGLVDLVSFDGGPLVDVDPEPWVRVALLAAGCVAICVKRAHPMLALGAGVLLVGADLALGGSLALTLVLWDLLYSAGLRAGPTARRVLVWAVAVVVVAAAVAAGEATRDVRAFVFTGLQLGAVLGVPLWWAANVRQKSELVELEAERADLAAERADLADRQAALERRRAADLERLAAAERHEAVAAERAAMARDLHDVIASHLSAIAIHSGAALATPPDPARDRAALELVRSSSLASLEEMRAMILLLRTGAPRDEVTAPGRLADLEDLLEAARAAGAAVVLDDPDGVLDGGLPAAVEQTLYRIAQEALTNATKHSPGAEVRVRLARTPARASGETRPRVELVVEHGPGSTSRAPGHPALTAGTGLVTMRERAEGLDGTFSAGPRADDGWRVRAVLPTDVPAVTEQVAR